MRTPSSRHALLHSRLTLVGSALKRLNRGDMTAVESLRDAIRRLRHTLPLLQLDADLTAKADTKLRKIARRLRPVQHIDAMLAAADDIAGTDRQLKQAEVRLKSELRRLRTKLSVGLILRKTTVDLNKLQMRLGSEADELIGAKETADMQRTRRWAVKARVARRALDLKRGIDSAGAVYLPGRLRGVRRAVHRLRVSAELLHDAAPSMREPALKPLDELGAVLDRLRDCERLVNEVRRLQGGLTPPDIKAWQELDDLISAVENRCRRLHGRYVREREAAATLADRLGAKAATGGHASKRKVS